MKVYAFILLCAFCYVECRKILQPIDKSANTAFINMEGGGARPPPSQVNPSPVKPVATVQPAGPAPVQPAGPAPVQPASATPKPASPQVQPAKPVTPTTPQPAGSKPTSPSQITPKPVYPPQPIKPITTPGPGTVKQLVNFYDSQGKTSPIRPYTYSQAVKQG